MPNTERIAHLGMLIVLCMHIECQLSLLIRFNRSTHRQCDLMIDRNVYSLARNEVIYNFGSIHSI